MTHLLRTLALPAALAATLALTSCGTDPSTPSAGGTASVSGTASASGSPSAAGPSYPVGPPATGPSNPADVEFANTMIYYHLHSEAMADLVPKHAKDARIKALAPTFKKAQGPEVTSMAGWLVGGGMPPPSMQGGEVAGHNMAGMGGQTKSMMTAEEMTVLGKASGPAFDRMWLQLMIRNHQGALVLAQTELAKGLNTEAKKIAQAVIDRQSAEIAKMQSILTGISG